MSGLISNTELTEELETIIPNCQSLNIISAFMTQPATRWLSQLVEGNCPSVKLVGRFTPLDFIQGSSDLDALRDCIAQGFQVKALTNLHAKIFQVDEETIFSGSANLTGKGLALVSDCNVEACNKVQASSSSKEFINKIINSASELTLEIIDEMELAVAPNPASNYISVGLKAKSAIQATLVLSGIDGNEIKSQNLRIDENLAVRTFDVADLPAGMYLIQVRTKAGITTKKIVVQ